MARTRCNRRFKGGYGVGRTPAPFWLGRVTKSQGGCDPAAFRERAKLRGERSEFFEKVYADASRVG